MESFSTRFIVIIALCSVAHATPAQDESLEMGRLIAEEYCVECHNIESDGQFKQDPPSFAAIAKYLSSKQIEARIFEPIHEEMPRYKDYMIGGNIPDMVAYISSLRD